MGIQERKERERTKMQKLILNTALSLFNKNGVNNISIRNISTVIEYSPATIYLYFKDKNEILENLRNEFVGEFEKKLMEFEFIKDQFSRLKNITQSWIGFALDEPQKYKMIFYPGIPLKDDIIYNYIHQSVREGIQQNQIQPLPLMDASLSIIAFLHGMSLLAVDGKIGIENKTELKDYIGDQINRFLRQLKGNALI